MAEYEGSEGESTPECEGSECEGSEGESTPEYEGSDIGDKDGLIGNEMGLSVTEWAYRRRNGLIGNGFCFGLGLEPSRTVISVGCRSRHEWFNDWVWVWVWTVANGYQRWFGFLSTTVWEVIGDCLGVIGDG